MLQRPVESALHFFVKQRQRNEAKKTPSTANSQVSRASISNCLGLQKNARRRYHQHLKPFPSEPLHPHASPPVVSGKFNFPSNRFGHLRLRAAASFEWRGSVRNAKCAVVRFCRRLSAHSAVPDLIATDTGGEACGYPLTKREGFKRRSYGVERFSEVPNRGNCTLGPLKN